MFDIGQNDLAGAFYSKSYDQILATIPTILVEFETGIKVSFIHHFLNKIAISGTLNSHTCRLVFFRNYMIKGLGIFGYTTRVLLDAWLKILPDLELTHQSWMS